MLRSIFTIASLLWLSLGAAAQAGPAPAELREVSPPSPPTTGPDTLRIAFLDFLGQVLQYHPIAKQAQIKAESGDAYVKVARGAFDPYLGAVWDAKRYGGKDYWQVFEGGVKVPTWFGTELYAGWSSAVGSNLDPSQSLPSAGQTALGVEVNLGRGLFIDQRRADLQKAKLYAQATQVEQQMMLLRLVESATNAYWEWWLAFANQQTYREALQLAQVRHEAVVASYRRGENPAIDTVEAYLQVQNRFLNQSEANAARLKAQTLLNNFLWNPDGEPVELVKAALPADSMPPLPTPFSMQDAAIDSLIAQHPELQYYALQQSQWEFEERWRREQLKPELALKYQALTYAPKEGNGIGTLDPAANLKWGVKFSFPLFLRKQRGYLELARLNVQDLEWTQAQKSLELRNKIIAIMGTLDQTRQQTQLAADMVDNYFALVRAENVRFESGESSVFLVNAREQRLIEAELKLNSLKAKLPSLWAELNRATGGILFVR